MKLILSIDKTSLVEQDIKKSRFITRIMPIKNEEEANQEIKHINEIESKANHNCFAFILGDHQEIQRASDDGEPSGTAGVPILEVIKREKLTNILVIVTRYFGGIKLGAGGLIRAYGSSASLAVQKASLVQLVDQELLAITIDYQNNDQLQYYLEQNNLPPLETEYTTQVTITIAIDKVNLDSTKAEITGIFNGNVSFKQLGSKRVALPYLQNKNEATT